MPLEPLILVFVEFDVRVHTQTCHNCDQRKEAEKAKDVDICVPFRQIEFVQATQCVALYPVEGVVAV